jgi:hypothetical protein
MKYEVKVKLTDIHLNEFDEVIQLDLHKTGLSEDQLNDAIIQEIRSLRAGIGGLVFKSRNIYNQYNILRITLPHYMSIKV